MKTKILDTNKTEKGTKDLPVQFSEQIREDLIQRAVLSVQAEARQAYGTKPGAGTRQVSEVSRRRRDYKATYGAGISRVPRKIMSRNGTRMNWVGAIAPGTVGGRQANPPKAEKNWSQKINEKENRKAIRSAIAATVDVNLVNKRGHKVPKDFPFIVDSKFESLNKTKDVYKALEKLGFETELKRTSGSNVRSGSGKNRGRKYHNKIGPLFVVGNECQLLNAAKNIPGVDVVSANSLNAELLAPGCHPGRLTLWTENAIDVLAKEKLFTEDYHGKTIVKEISSPKKKETSHAPKKETKRVEAHKPEAKRPNYAPVDKKAEVKKEIEKEKVSKEHNEVEKIMKDLKAKAMK